MSHVGPMTWLHRLEFLMASAVTVLLAGMQIRYFLRGGGLWQDEIGTVNLASMASLSEMWEQLPNEKIPVFPLLLLRCWVSLGFASDMALRVPGLVLGFLILAGFWRLARQFGCLAPLIALAFFGLNFEATRTIGFIRGYGLGILLNLCMLSFVWQYVQNPTRRNFWLAAFSTILTVHTLFNNSVLVFAVLAAGMLVCSLKHEWKKTLLLFFMGLLALATMSIYVPMILRSRDWTVISAPRPDQVTLHEFFSDLMVAMAPLAHFWAVFWGCAAAVVLLPVVRRNVQPTLSESSAERAKLLFLGTALVVGAVGYSLFLYNAAQYFPPKHFIVFFGFSAVLAESLLQGVLGRYLSCRLLVLAAVGIACCSQVVPIWHRAGESESEMTQVARFLEEHANKDDVIVLSHFVLGMIFDRYYHGPAEWFTIPPLKDYRTHRQDLYKRRMLEDDAIKPILDRIENALKNGHKVYVLNPQFNVRPSAGGVLARPPLPDTGWNMEPYQNEWNWQLNVFLSRHIPNETRDSSSLVFQSMHRFRLGLVCFRGWQP